MKTTLPCFALLLLFVSCATPQSIVRVEPQAERADLTSRYFYGIQIIGQTIGEMTAEAGFYDAEPDFLIFHIELENISTTEAYDLDPADFYLRTGEDNRIRAIDPEVQRLGMDVEQSINVAKQKNANLAMGLLAIGATVAVGVADFNQAGAVAADNANAIATVANVSLDVATTAAILLIPDDNRTVNYYAPPYSGNVPPTYDRLFWLDHALRRTSLRPGERIVGKLVFPRADFISDVQLVMPLPDGEAVLPFRQEIINPGPVRNNRRTN